MTSNPVGLTLSDGYDLSGMTLQQAWIRYITVGGTDSPAQLERQIRGAAGTSDHQHDVIAQALNEHFIELGQNHPIGYSRTQTELSGLDDL
jgi:hypothetical protein